MVFVMMIGGCRHTPITRFIGKMLTKHYAAQVKAMFSLDLDAYHNQHPMICRAARATNVQFLPVPKGISEGAPETL